MPTHAEKPAFLRAYNRLSLEQQTQFEAALAVFVAALAGIETGHANTFPAKLRIKEEKGAARLLEQLGQDCYGPARVGPNLIRSQSSSPNKNMSTLFL